MLPPCVGCAATLVVTTAADTAGNTCGATCSLRQAVNAANLLSGGDTITFNLPGPEPFNNPFRNLKR